MRACCLLSIRSHVNSVRVENVGNDNNDSAQLLRLRCLSSPLTARKSRAESRDENNNPYNKRREKVRATATKFLSTDPHSPSPTH